MTDHTTFDPQGEAAGRVLTAEEVAEYGNYVAGRFGDALCASHEALRARIFALEAENATLHGEEECLSASGPKPHQPITRDGKTTCYRCGETLHSEEGPK